MSSREMVNAFLRENLEHIQGQFTTPEGHFALDATGTKAFILWAREKGYEIPFLKKRLDELVSMDAAKCESLDATLREKYA